MTRLFLSHCTLQSLKGECFKPPVRATTTLSELRPLDHLRSDSKQSIPSLRPRATTQTHADPVRLPPPRRPSFELRAPQHPLPSPPHTSPAVRAPIPTPTPTPQRLHSQGLWFNCRFTISISLHQESLRSTTMNWVQRKIYLYNVTFGLYMLDWWERCLFNTLVVVLMWFILYNGSKYAVEFSKRYLW